MSLTDSKALHSVLVAKFFILCGSLGLGSSVQNVLDLLTYLLMTHLDLNAIAYLALDVCVTHILYSMSKNVRLQYTFLLPFPLSLSLSLSPYDAEF